MAICKINYEGKQFTIFKAEPHIHQQMALLCPKWRAYVISYQLHMQRQSDN